MEFAFRTIIKEPVKREYFKAEMFYFRADVLMKTYNSLKKFNNPLLRKAFVRKLPGHLHVVDDMIKHIMETFQLSITENKNTGEMEVLIVFSDLFFDMPLSSLPFKIPKISSMFQKWNPEKFKDIMIGQVKKYHGNAELLYIKTGEEMNKIVSKGKRKDERRKKKAV